MAKTFRTKLWIVYGSWHGRLICGLPILGFAVGLWCGLLSMDAQAMSRSELCHGDLLRDYEQPLRRMPADHAPPTGDLAFAPVGVSLHSMGLHKVFIQGDKVGYRLSIKRARSQTDRYRHPVTLRWSVTATLHTIDRQGNSKRVAARKRMRLGKIRYRENVEIGLREKPGLYRLEVAINNWSGQRLGTYYQYIRILPARTRARIAATGMSFHVGELITGRIENLGTSTVLWSAAEALKMERYTDGGWVEVLMNRGAGVTGVDKFIYGGRAGPCATFYIPLDAMAGSYRFSTEIEFLGTKVRRVKLARNFSVVP